MFVGLTDYQAQVRVILGLHAIHAQNVASRLDVKLLRLASFDHLTSDNDKNDNSKNVNNKGSDRSPDLAGAVRTRKGE